MKLWVVGHGVQGRNWLKVRIRPMGGDPPREAYIFGEWHADAQKEQPGFAVPLEPREAPWPNTDPLVIGREMYFSYCKKGQKSNLVNLAGPNSLEAGDLVLFGGHQEGRVILDTVFVVGEYREWPLEDGAVPDWDLEPIAARTHFHAKAQKQHPEVHSPRTVRSRSYRGRRYDESSQLFSWVPAFERPAEPFSLAPGDPAYDVLFGLYGKPAVSLFQGSFPVISIPAERGNAVFAGVLAAARAQGCLIAAGVDLLRPPEGFSKADFFRGT